MSTGRFIVLEGIDGAGTTTQTRLLQEWLARRGIKAHPTREPSDGPIGTLLRGVLSGRIRESQAAGGGPLSQAAIALLFAADRVDHVACEVRPTLSQGFWVLSDRYVASSIAYQGTLVDAAWTAEINRFAPLPDVTFLLDLPASVALQRVHQGRVGEELYEKQEILEKVASSYRTQARANPDAFCVVDGTLPPSQVLAHICAELTRRFSELAA